MTQQNETEQDEAAPRLPEAQPAPPQAASGLPEAQPAPPQAASGLPEAQPAPPQAASGLPEAPALPQEPSDLRPSGEESAGAPPQPAPMYPSPYLGAGESVPHAYLAPPQQGQPRYAAPAPYRPPMSLRRVQSGSGQQGDPGTGYGQPVTGQPGAGRPAFGLGAAARRDPALAPAWYRLVAAALDWMIIFIVSIAAFWSPLSQVWRDVQAVTSRYPNLTSPAAQAAIDSVTRNQANQHALLYWFLGMFGIALVYFWVQHAAWGATLGKRALGVRVVRASDRSRIGVATAGIRAVAYLAGPAIFLLLIAPFNVAGGVLWAADGGVALLNGQAQSLHDKLAGTIVVRQRQLSQRAGSSSPW
jgi:uncharacterized RDD family membrane protein YckC